MEFVKLSHNMQINKFHVTIQCTIFVIFSCSGQHFRYMFYYGVFLRDHIEEGEMRGTCGMCGGEDTRIQGFGWET